MPDFARTNPERPRINSNRTSNKPERSTLIQQTKNKPTHYLAKQKTLRNEKNYNTTK